MDVSIKKFNNVLNSSLDIAQKHLMWESYRSNVTDMIETAIISHPKGKSILVYGAGQCNDLDLPFFVKHFEKIVLTDVDYDNVIKGLKHQKVFDAYRNGQILIKEMEYTGLSKLMFFETMLDHFKKGETAEVIKAYIQIIQRQLEQSEALIENDSYDFVLSSAVYTQLIYTQLQALLVRIKQQRCYQEEEFVKIEEVLLDIMPFMLRRYNKGLLQQLKPDGLIMCMTDVLEDHIDGEFLKKVREKINDTYFVDDFYKQYTNESGYGLGSYGLVNLQTLVKTQIRQWAIWPFDDQRYFLVHFLIGSV